MLLFSMGSFRNEKTTQHRFTLNCKIFRDFVCLLENWKETFACWYNPSTFNKLSFYYMLISCFTKECFYMPMPFYLCHNFTSFIAGVPMWRAHGHLVTCLKQFISEIGWTLLLRTRICLCKTASIQHTRRWELLCAHINACTILSSWCWTVSVHFCLLPVEIR